MHIENVSASCGIVYQFMNTATVTDTTKFIAVSSSIGVFISAEGCGGCTHTIGYWKNHSGQGPQPDFVSQYLPLMLGDSGPQTVSVATAFQAWQILSIDGTYGPPSNGIAKLYAQLLAAKLNIANGANGTAVFSVIQSADVFLGAHAWTSWGSLLRSQKQMVLDWVSALDEYNNGITGPGHCE